ncbi:unannotated protein [freshwater metagenome]|uniref:Unannotated protein n=1 Tax=freshwater metagenome TaxID=449393 RepID=A0A6J7DVH1_9ZZZZ
MNGSRDFANSVLVHAVGRGVGDHQSRQIVPVLGNLGSKIVNVDITVVTARHDNDLHSGEDGGGRVSAVSTRRNEAGITVVVTTRQVVPANREEASEFTLATRVRLETDGVVAGQFGEPLFQLRDEEKVPADVRCGREGVDSSEFAPRDGFHFGCRVELHRARPERNHSAVEGEVLVCETLEEAHHRRFTVVRVEHGMSEDVVRTTKRFRNSRVRDRGNRVRCSLGGQPEDWVDEHIIATRQNSRRESGRQFVEADLNRVVVRNVEQKPGSVGGRRQRLRLARNSNLDGVEEVRVDHVMTSGFCPACESIRFFRHINRDLTKSGWSVIHGVHRSKNSE